MSSRFAHVEDLAGALLSEGRVLYPYRASALKNQRAFPFGVLAPRAFAEAVGGSERWRARIECLVAGNASFEAELRFVEAHADAEAEAQRARVASTTLRALSAAPLRQDYSVQAQRLSIEVRAEPLERALHRVSLEVRNTAAVELDEDALRGRPSREFRAAMLTRSLCSVHVFAGLSAGAARFVSLLEPPPALLAHAASCTHDGLFPVLVGPRQRADTLLASPVLTYDYPRLAPESPGQSFDNTEIDEMIALRVLTLSDAEKNELREGGGAGAALLARTEGLEPDALSALHGRLSQRPPSQVTGREGADVVPGDSVTLRPTGRGDAMDVTLAGRRATVATIEQDVDGTLLVCVTVDDDPGRDLGLLGFPGHRFFFRPEELERNA